MADIRTAFPKGCRVRFTPAAQKQFSRLARASGLATVVGYSRNGECLWIHFDGAAPRYTQCFHRSYFERADETPAAAAQSEKGRDQ